MSLSPLGSGTNYYGSNLQLSTFPVDHLCSVDVRQGIAILQIHGVAPTLVPRTTLSHPPPSRWSLIACLEDFKNSPWAPGSEQKVGINRTHSKYNYPGNSPIISHQHFRPFHNVHSFHAGLIPIPLVVAVHALAIERQWSLPTGITPAMYSAAHRPVGAETGGTRRAVEVGTVHLGVERNHGADRLANDGRKARLNDDQALQKHPRVEELWEELGLAEMDTPAMPARQCVQTMRRLW